MAGSLTSVVVVSYNSGPLLNRAVRSSLASTSPVEVIVVDNGSSDGSLAELRRELHDEPRLRVIEVGRNTGFAAAANRGISLSRGDRVALLNPDAELRPETIARVRAALDARPTAGMAGCLVLNPDGTEQAGCRRDTPTPGKALVHAIGLARLAGRLGLAGSAVRGFVRRGDPLPADTVEVDAISGAFMVVRREAIDTVGMLDEGYFLHCEDLDWCERFRRAGYGVLFVPDVALVHDKGGSSRDRQVRVLWHMHRGMLRYYSKFFRRRYPLPLMWLVLAGVSLRFTALASLALARRASKHVFGR